MQSSFYIQTLEKYSFYYNREKELIVVYQNIEIHHSSGHVDESLTVMRTFYKDKMSLIDWNIIYQVIIKRDKKYALLYRKLEYEPFQWACYQVMGGNNFFVSNKSLNPETSHFDESIDKIF